ncbi:hypothetical protein RvY_10704 [Ramazzottius varieornatus]|uniref:pyridoxal 5'-phosphate synthase n=1 Tax=Ramazzottius varieornatus TaxID=947166 RepID=A0A1D1VFP1_RAMVA|nr:hypothetical protein RvY_10704 [Ramazzottius varieornatus]
MKVATRLSLSATEAAASLITPPDSVPVSYMLAPLRCSSVRQRRFLNKVFVRNSPGSMEAVRDPPMSADNAVDLSGMRVPYHNSKNPFLESDLKALEPIEQFRQWFAETCNTPGIKEPNAVALATSTPDGKPSCRMVLLKGFSKQGFRFFTNYESRKGSELAANPRACMMFYWDHKDRSVRIEGAVEKLTEEESTEYFQQRPLGSQVAATISRQSTVVPDRNFLADQAEALYAGSENRGQPLPRPSFWGGFNLVPETVEFWQGQTNRLHDRIRFRRPAPGEKLDEKLTHVGEDGWFYERLSP